MCHHTYDWNIVNCDVKQTIQQQQFCQWQDWNSSKLTSCGESTRLREVKQFSSDVFFFNTQSWWTLPSFGLYCVPMHTNLFKILCFSCQGKSRDIVYQRICLFLLLIFAQHGLFENELTVYSALSRLTHLGIYDITRCGIWLLTIFHIPYIHFQRELRKFTSPKWYLSFFVQCMFISFGTNIKNWLSNQMSFHQ